MSRRSSRGGDPGSEPDSGEHTGISSGGHDHLGQRPSGARPAGAPAGSVALVNVQLRQGGQGCGRRYLGQDLDDEEEHQTDVATAVASTQLP